MRFTAKGDLLKMFQARHSDLFKKLLDLLREIPLLCSRRVTQKQQGALLFRLGYLIYFERKNLQKEM
jgi:hypothetical protein